jgi:iron complex outermembrane receptor protein
VKRFPPLPPVAAAAALLLASLPSLAAQEGQADARTFVVTASRVPEEADRTPSTVTVVTAEEIAASGAASVVEVLERAAGVSFRSYSGEAQAEISMRGFGENSSGRVLVLVDGRRLNNPDMQTIDWLSVPLADVERVEILQGASSVRYGNSAVGGVVNIITKKPSAGTKSTASLSAGSFGENRQTFSVDASGERGGVVASAEHYGTEGYRERSGYRSANASVRGTFDATDQLSLSAGIAMADVFYEMPGALTEAEFEDDPTRTNNYADEARDRSWTAELGAEWTPSETVSVSAPLSYANRSIASDMASWWTPAYTDRSVQVLQASPTGTWSAAAGPVPLRVVVGFDAYAAFLDVDTYGELARETKTNAFEVSQIAVGPFLTLRASLGERLTLEGGARYDQATIAAENVDSSVDESKTHRAFVYDGGIVYRPAAGVKTYARAGTLFRYPFTDEQTSFYGYGGDAFLADLEAERGYNVEGGASVQIGSFASLAADVYYMELTDEIALNSTFQNENLDKTRRFGADIDLKASPFPFIDVGAAYGYVSATFAAGGNEGNAVPLVPAHRLDARISLKAPFGLRVEPSASFRSAAYQGGDAANDQEKIDAYAVYGVAVRFVPQAFKGRLELSVKAQNLLDASYAPYVYYDSYYPAEGRSVNAGATYRY